ncbi:hypothetical protein ABH922_001776 [Rhodococcus sp. 27YEA15]
MSRMTVIIFLDIATTAGIRRIQTVNRSINTDRPVLRRSTPHTELRQSFRRQRVGRLEMPAVLDTRDHIGEECLPTPPIRLSGRETDAAMPVSEVRHSAQASQRCPGASSVPLPGEATGDVPSINRRGRWNSKPVDSRIDQGGKPFRNHPMPGRVRLQPVGVPQLAPLIVGDHRQADRSLARGHLADDDVCGGNVHIETLDRVAGSASCFDTSASAAVNTNPAVRDS